MALKKDDKINEEVFEKAKEGDLSLDEAEELRNVIAEFLAYSLTDLPIGNNEDEIKKWNERNIKERRRLERKINLPKLLELKKKLQETSRLDRDTKERLQKHLEKIQKLIDDYDIDEEDVVELKEAFKI